MLWSAIKYIYIMGDLRMKISKKLASVGLALSLAAMGVVPTFAATTNIVDSEQTESTYTDEFDGDFANEVTKNTDVEVRQAAYFSVVAPIKLVLDGAKTKDNKVDFNVTVSGDIDGDSIITVIPSLDTAIKAKSDRQAEGVTYTEFDTTKGVGTFPLVETGGKKKDLKATLTLSDVDWAIDTDLLNTDGVETLSGVHNGSISVDKLTAGKFINTSSWVISIAER